MSNSSNSISNGVPLCEDFLAFEVIFGTCLDGEFELVTLLVFMMQ